MASLLPIVGPSFSQYLPAKSSLRKTAVLCTNSRPSASGRPRAGTAGNVELPNGVFWLDKASHNHDIVYGQVRRSCPLVKHSIKYQANARVHTRGPVGGQHTRNKLGHSKPWREGWDSKALNLM